MVAVSAVRHERLRPAALLKKAVNLSRLLLRGFFLRVCCTDPRRPVRVHVNEQPATPDNVLVPCRSVLPGESRRFARRESNAGLTGFNVMYTPFAASSFSNSLKQSSALSKYPDTVPVRQLPRSWASTARTSNTRPVPGMAESALRTSSCENNSLMFAPPSICVSSWAMIACCFGERCFFPPTLRMNCRFPIRQIGTHGETRQTKAVPLACDCFGSRQPAQETPAEGARQPHRQGAKRQWCCHLDMPSRRNRSSSAIGMMMCRNARFGLIRPRAMSLRSVISEMPPRYRQDSFSLRAPGGMLTLSRLVL